MIAIETLFAILAGLILGSFFNVLIWRLPRGESIAFPASHCPLCGHRIRPFENIPVISYLLLRGRCSGCRAAISPVYPMVEAATAVGAVTLWHLLIAPHAASWPHNVHFIMQGVVLLFMVPVTVIDLRHTIIPDAITLPLIVAAILLSFIPGETTPLQSILGLLAGGGSLMLIGWIGSAVFRKEEAMGGGDIKLLACFGALWGPIPALLCILFGSIYGSLGALILALLRRLNPSHMIPFGPFLALGIWTAILAGDWIVNGYIDFITGLFFR